MPNQEHFPEVFEGLKTILRPLSPPLLVQEDTADHFSLVAPPCREYPRGLFFGAVQLRKNYVSYHLMPIYIFSDLLTGVSESLKKRMQGKSCFNFTQLDEASINELTKLTTAGIARYRQERWL